METMTMNPEHAYVPQDAVELCKCGHHPYVHDVHEGGAVCTACQRAAQLLRPRIVQMREFDKVDWYGLAGCTSFEGGREPLVSYDIKIDGHDALVVLDANALTIQEMADAEGGEKLFEFTGMHAARFVALLKPDYAREELIAAGAEMVS